VPDSKQNFDVSNMHVLVIAQLFPPDMGGGSTRAYNVVKGLTSLGHKATVITAFPHYPTGKIPREYRWKLISVETVGKAKVIRVWVPPVASKGLARRLVLFVSFIGSSLFALPFVGDVDVLWAANPNILSVYSALVYRFFKRCPTVQNADDLWPEELYNLGILNSRILRKIAESIARLAYATSKAVTPISPAYVDVIVNKYEVDSRRVHVVPAGADLDNFRASVVKCEKEGDIFKVLYIGALSPAYDFDYVLEAANMLSSENRIKFIIQGQGELGEQLMLKIRAMNLHNVDAILRVVSRRKVAEVLRSADVLLLPLRKLEYTGISSKLYEYQASGKPIICCARGQPARYIAKTGSGIIVTPGDYDGLSKAIVFLFNNRDVAEKMGNAGRKYVEENLSCEKIGLKLEEIFKATLASNAMAQSSISKFRG